MDEKQARISVLLSPMLFSRRVWTGQITEQNILVVPFLWILDSVTSVSQSLILLNHDMPSLAGEKPGGHEKNRKQLFVAFPSPNLCNFHFFLSVYLCNFNTWNSNWMKCIKSWQGFFFLSCVMFPGVSVVVVLQDDLQEVQICDW